MKPPWLIVDVHNVCWRMHHTMGHLSSEDSPTGVVFGFLNELVSLRNQFGVPLGPIPGFAFCFDHGIPHRKNRLATYKASRKQRYKNDPEARKAKQIVSRQIRQLRDEVLPSLGFTHLFWDDGFEADDLIASCCLHLPKEETAVVVSTDKDLYQVITKRITLYRHIKPPQEITLDRFVKEWGMGPQFWPRVKALAGCSSDDIPGIKGVGEITAAKWLKHELKPNIKANKAIQSPEGMKLMVSNLALTTLPYIGCSQLVLHDKDKVSSRKWNEVVKDLGMKSLINKW